MQSINTTTPNVCPGKVEINGKIYETVNSRMQRFREKHPDESLWRITTELVYASEDRFIVKASITSPEGIVIATGHAEEIRNSSFINRNAPMENAETSAIGRALAAAGYLGTEFFASADEVILAQKAEVARREQSHKVKIETRKVETQKIEVPKAKTNPNPTPEVRKTQSPQVQQKQATAIVGLPDITKHGWEKMQVPKTFLPRIERHRAIRWIDLIVDSVKLRGRKRILTGAQYLHALQGWKILIIQNPKVQAVIKAALDMRQRIKTAIAVEMELV